MSKNGDYLNISVVIPVYNSEQWIARAIQSVLNQTVKPNEIIVVNDGSTDHTAEDIKKFDNHVRYIYQDNAGPGAARNNGIKNTTGEWIAFLDADDQWYRYKLASQIAILSRYENLKWCACSYDIQKASGIEKRTIGYLSRHELVAHGFFPNALRIARRDSFFHTSGMLIHKSVFDKVGLFDESLRQAQDNDLWRRIALQYPTIGYCSFPCHIYHTEIEGSVAKGNASSSCNFRSMAKSLPIAKKYSPELYNEFLRLARATSFRWLVKLPFQRPDLLGTTYKEYLGIVPLSKPATIILKIMRILPQKIARKLAGPIRDFSHFWNRWR